MVVQRVVQRCRGGAGGAEVQTRWVRGGEVQTRCVRGAEVERWRGAEVQRCSCAEQVLLIAQMIVQCAGAEVVQC